MTNQELLNLHSFTKEFKKTVHFIGRYETIDDELNLRISSDCKSFFTANQTLINTINDIDKCADIFYFARLLLNVKVVCSGNNFTEKLALYNAALSFAQLEY